MAGLLLGLVTFCTVLAGKYLEYHARTGIPEPLHAGTYNDRLVTGARLVREMFSGQVAVSRFSADTARGNEVDEDNTTPAFPVTGQDPGKSGDKAGMGYLQRNTPLRTGENTNPAPATNHFNSAPATAGVAEPGGAVARESGVNTGTIAARGSSGFATPSSLPMTDNSRIADASETIDPAASGAGTVDEPVSQPAQVQPWATPDCPVELPQGSTATEAEAMQIQYGCRYLHYCRLLNDGSDDSLCWYGLFSAPSLTS